MSMTINDDCTSCAACEDECPTEAIRRGEDRFEVDVERCTRCEGEFEAPRCVAVCPVDGCITTAA